MSDTRFMVDPNGEVRMTFTPAEFREFRVIAACGMEEALEYCRETRNVSKYTVTARVANRIMAASREIDRREL